MSSACDNSTHRYPNISHSQSIPPLPAHVTTFIYISTKCLNSHAYSTMHSMSSLPIQELFFGSQNDINFARARKGHGRNKNESLFQKRRPSARRPIRPSAHPSIHSFAHLEFPTGCVIKALHLFRHRLE